MAVSEETPIPGKPSLPIALAEAGMGHPFFLFTGRGLKGKPEKRSFGANPPYRIRRLAVTAGKKQSLRGLPILQMLINEFHQFFLRAVTDDLVDHFAVFEEN